jgi:RNA polymerase sigma-70 factor (ECF subfamily)
MPEDAIALARDAWPQITGDPTQFAAYLAERGNVDHVTDLYLAWGCANGDPAALAGFEQYVVGHLTAVLAHMRIASDLADEIRQRVRDKVLLGKAGEPPKIVDYSGRGPLKGWLRAVATRTALDALRQQARQPTTDDALFQNLPAAFDDPTTAELRRRYAPQFADAFREAFAELDTGDRLLLKRHFADGLTTHQIGTIDRVHRVTVLRRLTRALDKMSARIEDLLGDRLGLTPSELTSVVQAIRSQVELSLSALRER